MEKIRKIFLFVHPLFEEYERYEGDPPIGEDFGESAKKGIRRLRPIIKNELHNYGLDINRAAMNDESLVIIVPGKRHPYAKELNRDLERLERYARKKLGNRLIVLNGIFGYDITLFKAWPKTDPVVSKAIEDARRKLAKFEFADHVKIKATGQDRGACVSVGKERMEKIITGFGKRVTSHIGDAASGLEHAFAVSALIGKLGSPKKGVQKASYWGFSKWRREAFGKRKIRKN